MPFAPNALECWYKYGDCMETVQAMDLLRLPIVGTYQSFVRTLSVSQDHPRAKYTQVYVWWTGRSEDITPGNIARIKQLFKKNGFIHGQLIR